MSLLAHHMKKDARHLRWLLGLWVLLVAAEALLINFGNRAEPDNLPAQIAYQMISVLLPMLQYLLVIVMVPLLVQDEPLVGTTAFWFTRPVPRRLLLSSKALFCLLAFVVLPALVELAVLSINRVPLMDVASVAPEIIFSALLRLACAFALAALTLNFARYAIVGAAAIVAIVVISAAVTLTMLFVFGLEETAFAKPASLLVSRSIVSNVVVLLLCLATIVNQYLTRRTGWSVVLAVLAIAGSFAVSSFWQIDFMQRETQAPADSVVDCEKLSIGPRFESADSSTKSFGRRAKATQRVRAEVSVHGLPPAHVADVAAMRTRFTPEGEEASTISSTNRETLYYRSDWTKKNLSDLFPGLRIIGQDITYSRYADILTLPPPQYLELKNKRGALDGEADVLVDRLVVSHTFSLEPGSRFHEGPVEETIGEVNAESGGVIILVRRSQLTRNWARLRKGTRPGEENANKRKVYYVLVNRERGEVVMPNDDSFVDFNFSSFPFHLSVKSFSLRYPADRLAERESSFAIDADWLAGAELVRLARERVAECTVAFHEDDFSMTEDLSSKARSVHKHTIPADDLAP